MDVNEGPSTSKAKEEKNPLPVFADLFDTETDKKCFTDLGRAKLLEKASIDAKRIRTFSVHKNSPFSEQIHVASVIQPDLLVIHFSSLLSPTDPNLQQLLWDMSLEWRASPGFDMSTNFPGEGVYVAAAVDIASDHDDAQHIIKCREASNNQLGYPNPVGFSEVGANQNLVAIPLQESHSSAVDDLGYQFAAATSLDSNNSELPPVGAKTTVYYRGFITKLKPGKDMYSAHYEIFLYDKGTFKEFTVDEIIPLSKKFRLTVPPQYILLKFPGLKPVRLIQRTVELFTRKKVIVREYTDSWFPHTRKLVKDLLSSKILKLDVLGTHGLYVFANLILHDAVNNDVHMDYVKYLEHNDLAKVDESYFDEMLMDAENEEEGDWKLLARTCY